MSFITCTDLPQKGNFFSKFILLVVDFCLEYGDSSMFIYLNVNGHIVIIHFNYKILLQCVLHTNSDL